MLDVGDRLIGVSGGWENTEVEILFISQDGKIGDVRLNNGEEAGVNFIHFKKCDKD